jgi:tetratricopeptide (TPR) repeat protein
MKALNNLALAFYVQDYFSIAMDYYEMALELIEEEEPIHADIYSNLGNCYANQDPPDLTKAMAAYDNAIRISWEAEWGDDIVLAVDDENFNYTDAYYNRGNLYYRENNYDKALDDYSVTIIFYENALSPDSDVLENAYYNRGLCYYNKELYSEAIDDYEKTIELNPGYIWAYYAKGFAHYMSYEDTEALVEYQKVLDSGNTEVSPYALFGMGLVNVRNKDTFDQGMDYLQQSCDTGQCSIACETLEQGLYADPGTILDFELPQ